MFRTPVSARPSATRAGAGRPHDQTHPTMNRASGAHWAPISRRLRNRKKTLESKTLDAGRGPTEFHRRRPVRPTKTLDTVASTVCVSVLPVIEPVRHRRSQHCHERMCSFIASRARKPSCRCRRPNRVNGPARVCMPRFQRHRPDAMELDDAIPGTDRPGDPLGMLHRYPAAGPLARSGRDEVAVGLTGTRTHGR